MLEPKPNPKIAALSERLKKVEEVYGGLRTKLRLPWDRPPIFENFIVDEDKQHEKCLKIVYTSSDFSEIGARRRHGRLLIKDTLTFFPASIERLRLPSKLGTHLWQLNIANIKPDDYFLKFLETGLLNTLPRMRNCQEQMNIFILNQSLINFNWLHEQIRKETLETISYFLKDQKDLSHVILENAMLNFQDGLRLLYIFGYHCGEQIEYLNVVYFFKTGLQPIKNVDREYMLHDGYEYNEEDEIMSTTEVQKFIWERMIRRVSDFTIPEREFRRIYKICLNMYSSLKSLHIQYSYLCAGQGKSLCHIASIINGTLKELYLICTPPDLPKNTNQYIKEDAWNQALSTCPFLKLHLIFSSVPYYDFIKTLIYPVLPLVSFHMDSGINNLDFESMNSWYFGSTVKMLISSFYHKLRVLNFHLWHCNQKLDVSICKCITHFHYLEKFEYRGPFDKLDTIYELCEFITSTRLHLKLVHIYVLEDPCNPDLYQDAVKKVYEKYKGKFIAKDIDFILSTTCI